eukprot:TRINITY_DN6684_c0_g1_i1.p1 TRINITY_DN6684_c0_g1~~TRINITY_DN6684_c0_g1_i1.p1  ORF type:complete len:135 (+),score=11.27 TRINITY_DN6684_c0_g1_i1:43-447(+)
MRHLAAYLLLVAGGNATPSAADVTALLAQAGIEVDQTRLNQLMTDLEGKDIAEIIAAGKESLWLLVLPLPPLLLPPPAVLLLLPLPLLPRSPRLRKSMPLMVAWTCSVVEVPRLVTIKRSSCSPTSVRLSVLLF